VSNVEMLQNIFTEGVIPRASTHFCGKLNGINFKTMITKSSGVSASTKLEIASPAWPCLADKLPCSVSSLWGEGVNRLLIMSQRFNGININGAHFENLFRWERESFEINDQREIGKLATGTFVKISL